MYNASAPSPHIPGVDHDVVSARLAAIEERLDSIARHLNEMKNLMAMLVVLCAVGEQYKN